MNLIERLSQQPEYLHVLLNPLPIYGLAMGLIGLIIALALRSRPAKIVALVIIFLSAASAWPVFELGEKAANHVESLADADGRAWLEAHEHRADQFIFFFYGLAVLSAVAITAPLKWPKSSPLLAIAVLLLGGAVLGMGGYIAYAGGKIRHREFRLEPPPEKVSQTSPAFGHSFVACVW
jgi:disulfide bond formation protein DsbB